MPTPAAGDTAQNAPIGRLALANGMVFEGRAFGAVGKGLTTAAEVVFNTAMCGYQESLTDPSYTGQILVATVPLVGNTGTNAQDIESARVQVSGFIVRELARLHSNYRSNSTLSNYLAQSNILGLEGIDTRALTRILRTGGSMNGVLTDRTDLTDAQLVDLAKSAPSMAGQNLVPRVGCTSGSSWSETLGDWKPTDVPDSTHRYKVLALDCGAKMNILRNLAQRGCDVKVVPHDISAAEIKDLYARKEIDGLFISNGPGDPAAVNATISTLRDVISQAPENTIPTFGICLGHQLLSLAVGAKTYKLKFGHRGSNQPILNKRTGHVEITAQNHGFAVDLASLNAAGGEETHIHLNDQTVAGFRMPDRPVMSVQYHPEASPGPHDAGYLFDEFVASMAARKAR